MDNKSATSYDQLPHIVINHPETTPEHWAIMIAIYKILKDKQQCIYSDAKLSERSRVPIRTMQRALTQLEEWGFIIRIGEKQNRRFKLGKLFNTSANMHDKKLNTSASVAHASAKNDNYIRHGGGYTKNNILRTITNDSSLPSKPKKISQSAQEALEKMKQI